MKQIFGTKEWADATLDIQRGCEHGCRYCYAKAEAVRFGLPEIVRRSWGRPTPLMNNAKLKKLLRAGKPKRIMFPAHHDVTCLNVAHCMGALFQLIKAGHDVLVVSKPNPDLITWMCQSINPVLEVKNHIEFRFTIGSSTDKTLIFWEPHAPSLGDRLASLIIAQDAGYKTSVSIEPMLDTCPEKVVAVVRPYVTEAIWIGLPNFLAQRLALNGEPEYVRNAGKDLMASFTDDVVQRIYNNLKAEPLIQWKESMKKRLGLELATKSPGAGGREGGKQKTEDRGQKTERNRKGEE